MSSGGAYLLCDLCVKEEVFFFLYEVCWQVGMKCADRLADTFILYLK